MTRSLAPFAVAHEYLPIIEIHILHAQLQAFAQSETGAIQEARHQPLRAAHLREKKLHLLLRENRRPPYRTLGVLETLQRGKGLRDHLLVEKEKRRERLILGGRRDVSFLREVVEKSRDLRRAEIARMALPRKQDEALHPVQVGLLGAITEVPAPDRRTHQIEEPRARHALWRPDHHPI